MRSDRSRSDSTRPGDRVLLLSSVMFVVVLTWLSERFILFHTWKQERGLPDAFSRITLLLYDAPINKLLSLVQQICTASASATNPWFQTLTVIFLKLLLDANQPETVSPGIKFNDIHWKQSQRSFFYSSPPKCLNGFPSIVLIWCLKLWYT